MQRALRARKGPRYHEVREFLGRSRWDPLAFDLAEVNERLADLAPQPAATPVAASPPPPAASPRPGRSRPPAAPAPAPGSLADALGRLAAAAAAAERAAAGELAEAVRAATAAGASWGQVGRATGVTRQGARQRWAPPRADAGGS